MCEPAVNRAPAQQDCDLSDFAGIGDKELAHEPKLWQARLPMAQPTLKPQEIPYDDPDSNNMFEPSPDKPLVATPAAVEMYTHETIVACFRVLRGVADENNGLDYLQIFKDAEKPEDLWFIEDGEGGAITALLPSDY